MKSTTIKIYCLFTLLSNPIIKFKDRELLIATPVLLFLFRLVPCLVTYNGTRIQVPRKGYTTRWTVFAELNVNNTLLIFPVHYTLINVVFKSK